MDRESKKHRIPMPGAFVKWDHVRVMGKKPRCTRCYEIMDTPGEPIYWVSFYARKQEPIYDYDIGEFKLPNKKYWRNGFHPECYTKEAEDWYKANPYDPKTVAGPGRPKNKDLIHLTSEERARRTRLEQRKSRLVQRVLTRTDIEDDLKELGDICREIKLLGGIPRSWEQALWFPRVRERYM